VIRREGNEQRSRAHQSGDPRSNPGAGAAEREAGRRRQLTLQQRRGRVRHYQFECLSLLELIVATAQSIDQVRDIECLHLARTPRQRALLAVLARSRYCMTIPAVARALGITRQSARALVLNAARAGAVELLPHAEQGRTLLVELSSAVRKTLDAVRYEELVWSMILLHGLDERVMRKTAQVLDVIDRRLRSRIRQHERGHAVKSQSRRSRAGRSSVGRSGAGRSGAK
jgi:DNA-binding MarR family transcriptional regulator